MQRSVHGEVISSTFDEPAQRHVQVAEMVIEKAKRLVEHKKDVLILLDSDHAACARVQHRHSAFRQGAVRRSRFERASEAEAVLRRGAQHRRRRIADDHRDGAHRHRIAHGRRDLRGVQGHRQHGDPPGRKLVDKRVFPAIDIQKSGTRKEELLLPREDLNRIWVLRKVLNPLSPVEAMELLLDKMKKTPSNAEFLAAMQKMS